VADYLLIIGDCDALQWVLNKRRMAFPPHRERLAGELSRGDRVFLYTTRSCWRNPTRDRGRIAGVGRVISEVKLYRRPIEVAGRPFTSGCDVVWDRLAPPREGLELVPLVPRLQVFADTPAWYMQLRRPLLRLTDADGESLARELEPLTEPASKHRITSTSGPIGRTSR
jgi:hypothetical protein